MIARLLAGVLLGFPLAGALIALALYLLPDHGQAWLVPGLILFFPLWTAAIALAVGAPRARRAWFALAGADLLAFGALWLVRHIGG